MTQERAFIKAVDETKDHFDMKFGLHLSFDYGWIDLQYPDQNDNFTNIPSSVRCDFGNWIFFFVPSHDFLDFCDAIERNRSCFGAKSN
jgi:hypothetical protein